MFPSRAGEIARPKLKEEQEVIMQRFKILMLTVAVMLGVPSRACVIAAQSSVDEQVSEGKKVVIEFSITLPESKEMIPRSVSQYVQGQQQMIPALQQALIGLKSGDTKQVELAAEQAFGPYDENKRTTVARAELPTSVKTGSVMQNREGAPFTVLELSDQSAVVDYNHPLAGKRLVFDVKILKVEG